MIAIRPVMPFTDQISYVYADIRYAAESSGLPVGPNNLLIASIVMFHDGVLATHNTKEFSRIQGLRLEDWVSA